MRFRFAFIGVLFFSLVSLSARTEDIAPMPKVFLPLTWQTATGQLQTLFPGSSLKELRSWFSLRGWGKEKFRQGYGSAYCQDCEFTIGSIDAQITSVEIRKESQSVDEVERVFDQFEERLTAEIGGPSKSHGKKGKHVYYREWKRNGYLLRLTMESRSFSESFYFMVLSIQRTPKLKF